MSIELATIDKSMPLGLESLDLRSEYRTGQSNMVGDFYIPCFTKAMRYDRAVGFFRSSIFLLINEEIAHFAKRGGKIRLVCSPSLTEKDIEALSKGYLQKETAFEECLLNEIAELFSRPELIDRTEALATLISLGVLDVKIAFRPEAMGMYHEKLGVFKDEYKNSVSFKGSSNETWNGWHENGNYESIEVFCSWHNVGDTKRLERHSDYFEDLWSNRAEGITTFSFPEAAKQKLCEIAKDDIDQIQWQNFKPKSQPQGRKPFGHQTQAIQNWKLAGCKGILEHATGSGKTFTAIVALREHVHSGKPVLVLVPSKLLLRQWAKELQTEIPEGIILKAGDGNVSWKKNNMLEDFSANDPSQKPRLIVSTMTTAASDLFLKKLRQGEHLMIVADEVHQTGSPENSKIYTIAAGKRLGLSATPVRYGDPDGTQRMLVYFGGIIDPKYTLADAIANGRLVKYEYYPHAISLNATEADEWKTISKQISLEVARSPKDVGGNRKLSEKARMLLIRRSRIAKKASAKVQLVEKILTDHYEEGEKWLVYCEDKDQLNEVLLRLKSMNLHVNEYHTSMTSDMDATLAWYRKHGGILVSIRCLDEGVDIPDITHALILASSQNPRQFIQRRGRVLRVADQKFKAVLHDAIVLPVDVEGEPEQLSLVKSEMCRAIEFSKGAINKSSSAALIALAIDMNLNIDEVSQDGTEEEIEGE